MYVPKGVDLESLEGSAECRNKSKPLALSFIHKGRNLWRSSELKTTYDPEKLADDILLLQKTVSTEERLMIYSARENNIDTSKQGNESQKIYKFIERHFYNLSSKIKISRAFEMVWQETASISDKNFNSQYMKTNWPSIIEETLQKSIQVGRDLRKQDILIHC